MTDDHGTLEAFGVIFFMWAAVFFGVWGGFPLDYTIKIWLDVLSSVGFIMFGLLYFMVKGKIPFPSQDSMNKVRFWFGVVAYSYQIVIAFLMNYVTWEFATINGIQVVTYRDLLSLANGIIGVVVIILMIIFIRRRNPYKKPAPNAPSTRSPAAGSRARETRRLRRRRTNQA
jgi:magnesium-transporting ATPase (P-type)